MSTMDAESRKKAIYDQLSPRRRKWIDKVGYDKWDPFQEPNDPINLRVDVTRRTPQELVRLFQRESGRKGVSVSFDRGLREFCIGLINRDERYRAMYEFSLWYHDLLEREGRTEDFLA